MKNRGLILAIVLLMLPGLACSLGQPAGPPPDTQATINAAVVATGTAQAAGQATIEAAVAATTAAQATRQPPTPTSTPVVMPTDPPEAEAAVTAVAEEYVSMTEEELAALVDQAVNEAVAATEQYATTTSEAAADGTVSQDEVQTVEVYFANADEAIAYAEELLNAYTSMYGALAVEAVDELSDVENELAALVTAVDELNQVVADVDNTLEQGLELATETITQVETTAQTVSETAQTVQSQTEAWQAAQQTDRQDRIATAVAVQPNQANGDPQAAVKNVLEFVQAGQTATADGQLSATELAQLAQLGANASASLGQTGNPQLQDLSSIVTGVTEHLAGGNMPQAQAGLDQLGVAAPLALPADTVAQDPRGAIQSALDFATIGKELAAGGQPSPEQLVQLAQLGANASASLGASGMPQLQQLSGAVNDITGQIALGRSGQAQLQLDQLGGALASVPEVNLPDLPDKPSLPAKPAAPGKPSRPSK